MSGQKKGNPKPESESPPIPKKLYFTIGEAGELGGYVATFFVEQEFS